MGFEEFVNELTQMVAVRMGDEYHVVTKDIVKNNNCYYTGLVIQKMDNSEFSVSPAIYLEALYDEFQDEDGIEAMADQLIDIYNKCMEQSMCIDVNCIKGDMVEDNIFFRVVNYDENIEILKECPHVKFLDLAVTFHCLCSKDNKDINSFRITNLLMKQWNLDVDKLVELCDRNMETLFPDVLTNFSDFIYEYISDAEMYLGYDFNMYILTNNMGLNGASSMLYSRKLRQLLNESDCDIFILPSSIHELILVPVAINEDLDGLRQLVNEVNCTAVMPEERLSDNVYVLRKDSGRIEIAE